MRWQCHSRWTVPCPRPSLHSLPPMPPLTSTTYNNTNNNSSSRSSSFPLNKQTRFGCSFYSGRLLLLLSSRHTLGEFTMEMKPRWSACSETSHDHPRSHRTPSYAHTHVIPSNNARIAFTRLCATIKCVNGAYSSIELNDSFLEYVQ